MVNKQSMITIKTVLSNNTIETAGTGTIIAKTEREVVVNMTRGSNPGMLNCVLHVSNVKHSLISVSRLCDDGHTMKFSEKYLVVKKRASVIASGK